MTRPRPTVSARDSQQIQEGIADAARDEILAVYAHLDTSDLNKSLPTFKALVASIVQKYARASGAAAQHYYASARAANGLTSFFRPRMAPVPVTERIDKAVEYATRYLWDSEPNVAAAKSDLVAGTERLVLDTGRQTLVQNADRDADATGWARITEPGPCYFCALLASRGAVYRGSESADFQAHDNCRCHVEPIFGTYRPSAEVERWQQLYKDHAQGERNPLLAFRHAFDGQK